MKGLLVQCRYRMVSKPLGPEKTLRKAGSSDTELLYCKYRLDSAKENSGHLHASLRYRVLIKVEEAKVESERGGVKGTLHFLDEPCWGGSGVQARTHGAARTKVKS